MNDIPVVETVSPGIQCRTIAIHAPFSFAKRIRQNTLGAGIHIVISTGPLEASGIPHAVERLAGRQYLHVDE